MAITQQQVKDAIKQAKHADGSRGLAYIAGTRVAVEVEGVYNSRTSTTPWSFVYTLLDPLYHLNGGRCYGQKGQASFVAAVTCWLNSDKRTATQAGELEGRA